MPNLQIIVLLVGLPLLFYAFLTFDSLVLLQRGRYPSEWQRAGEPCPFFRRPSGLKWSLRGRFSAQWCSMAWLFAPPSWATSDPQARQLLFRLRVLVFCWCFLVVPAFALSAPLSFAHS
jgi:hypothetical protein